MNFDLVRIWHEMDIPAKGVTLALLLGGLVSLTVVIERLIAFARSRSQSRRFAAQAATLVDRGDLRELREAVAGYPASHLARLLEGPLDVYLAHEHEQGDKGEAVVELVRRELQRKHEETGTDLRRGLTVIASVGSIAPFVGLLGTVLGIIAAFAKISATGSGGLASVAGGISEALVVTALGLVIAIPAVLAFNMLSTRADKILQGLSASAGQFIDHVEFRHVGGLRAQPRPLVRSNDGRKLAEKAPRGDRSGVPAA